MKDPQKEINKRWSQALNMLNNQVQPGVFAEIDAFVDNDQAEQSMKEPGSVTYLNSGAIGQGKFQERGLPSFPNAPIQMEELAQSMLRKITGINPDLLGQDRGRQEPGVVVRLRQQQGLVLLKPLFRAVKRMKKQLFERQLAIITKYMPDSQILRILGEGERYQIDPNTGVISDKLTNMQASIRNLKELQYNVIPEEASGNMSKRMMELTAFMEMMSQGFPVPPESIIAKMDLPASEKAAWIKYINDQQAAQAKAMQEAAETELQLRQAELKIKAEKVQSDNLIGSAKVNQMANATDTKARIDLLELMMEHESVAAKFVQDLAKAELKRLADLEKEELKIAGEVANTVVDNATKPKPEPKNKQEGKKKDEAEN
jgi:hypothetical protein